MHAKTLSIPVVNRDALIDAAPMRGLSREQKSSWLRSRRLWVPTTLVLSVTPDLGRFEAEYRYARDHGRAGSEVELTHGSFRAFRRNGLVVRAHLRRAGPRKAAKAYGEWAELLRSIAAYARSLPEDYRDRWRMLLSAGLLSEHWTAEKEILTKALVPPFASPA